MKQSIDFPVSSTYKIGWILTGDYSFASSRLQGYRIHDYLTAQGCDSNIIADSFGQYETGYSPTFFSVLRKILHNHLDVVFFQKPGWMMFKMSEILRLRGIKTIAIQCDPFPGDYGHYFDATVLTTEELKQQLKIPNAYVIDDMLEVPLQVHKETYTAQSERLRVVWVGQGTGSGGRKFIEPFLNQLAQNPKIANNIEFVTISRGTWATHEWSLGTVYKLICDCDMAIIPLPEDNWANAKSANRLTMFMALGMPTIVSPVPSYLRIIQPGENSLLARTPDEFVTAIELYRNEERRKKLGSAGRELAINHFSPETLGPEWVKVIDETWQTPHAKPTSNTTTRLMSRLLQTAARL